MQFKISNIDICDLDIKKIKVYQIDTGTMIRLQKQMHKAVWRPAPGRKLAFIVTYEDKILGLIFFASPVINMLARDNVLNLSKDSSEKGKQLRNIADMSICAASQPFGWKWNGGKLIAMIATTLGNFWEERYKEELKHIVTTSLDRRGSQYNRVYKFIGYTKGYGHEHISNEEYKNMIKWMQENNVEVPSAKFGAGSNLRMRRIAAYKKASGNKTIGLKHNKIRGIYIHEAINPLKREEIVQNWFNRWGEKRFSQKKNEVPPYYNGLSDKNNVVIADEYIEISSITQNTIDRFCY
jgi:hypothetical protein